MLPIMEQFGPTIQGEGKRAGNISYFIRFGGCNFSCSGFGVRYTDPNGEEKFGCDSYYSVDRTFKKEWEFLTYTDMIEKMDSLIMAGNHGIMKPDIVITGGEPTMYWTNKEFQNFLLYYISRGYSITIETNASVDIEFTKDYQKEITFSMSVKLSNSGELEHRRINIDNITTILDNAPDSYFKFVVSATQKEQSVTEIKSILKEVPHYADVYLMPMGETIDELEKNALTVVETAIENNWKFSDRLHIRVWNDKAGV